MVQRLTKEFFLNEDYDGEINHQLSTIDQGNPDHLKFAFNNVLSLEDPYIIIYLIAKMCPKIKFISNEEIIRLGQVFKRFNDKMKIKTIDPLVIFKKLTDSFNIVEIDLKTFVKNLSDIDFDDREICEYQQIWGFSQIYAVFKDFLEACFVEFVDYKQIGLLLRLLSNGELAYKQYLVIFQRTTMYVTENFVEKSIVGCLEAIKGLLVFEKGLIQGKTEYLASLMSFAVQVLQDPKNYVFLDHSETEKMVHSVSVLASFIKNDAKTLKISNGIYQKCFDHFRELVERKTTVFEEFIVLSTELQLLLIFSKLSYETGSRILDFDLLAEYLMNIELQRPDAVSMKEWFVVRDRFILNKFSLLNFLYPIIENKQAILQMLYSDLETTKTKHKLLKVIENIVSEIEWDVIISLSCSKDCLEDFIELIFDDKFFEMSNKHYEYISIYIDAMKKYQRRDLLLYCEKKLLRRFKGQEISFHERRYILDLYFDHLNGSKHSVHTKRRLILSFLFYDTPNTLIALYLAEFLEMLFEREIFDYNINILVFFLVLNRKNSCLPADLLNSICDYFFTVLCKNFSKDIQANNINYENTEHKSESQGNESTKHSNYATISQGNKPSKHSTSGKPLKPENQTHYDIYKNHGNTNHLYDEYSYESKNTVTNERNEHSTNHSHRPNNLENMIDLSQIEEYHRIPTASLGPHTCLYLAALALILVHSNHRIEFFDSDRIPTDLVFFKICASLFCYFSGACDGSYLESTKDFLFIFLFYASEFQRSVLAGFYKLCDRSFECDTTISESLESTYHFLSSSLSSIL